MRAASRPRAHRGPTPVPRTGGLAPGSRRLSRGIGLLIATLLSLLLWALIAWGVVWLISSSGASHRLAGG